MRLQSTGRSRVAGPRAGRAGMWEQGSQSQTAGLPAPVPVLVLTLWSKVGGCQVGLNEARDQRGFSSRAGHLTEQAIKDTGRSKELTRAAPKRAGPWRSRPPVGQVEERPRPGCPSHRALTPWGSRSPPPHTWASGSRERLLAPRKPHASHSGRITATFARAQGSGYLLPRGHVLPAHPQGPHRPPAGFPTPGRQEVIQREPEPLGGAAPPLLLPTGL